MTIAQRIEPNTISIEEMERRRAIVRKAIASNRIEGAYHNSDVDPIFDDYIRGSIEFHEMLPRLNEIRGLKQS